MSTLWLIFAILATKQFLWFFLIIKYNYENNLYKNFKKYVRFFKADISKVQQSSMDGEHGNVKIVSKWIVSLYEVWHATQFFSQGRNIVTMCRANTVMVCVYATAFPASAKLMAALRAIVIDKSSGVRSGYRTDRATPWAGHIVKDVNSLG